LKTYLKQRQALVNGTLGKLLPSRRDFPASIHDAMRYSVLGEGKRIRPILALAASDAVRGKRARVLPAACALELIHAYSLVHDDLPAMDDDDFRRGKPSCHKKFGEALGVLTGDALLTFSFGLLAGVGSRVNGDAGVRLEAIREVAEAIGTFGMIGGQVADVGEGRRRPTRKQMERINNWKTGALIAASVRVGALLGSASASRKPAPGALRGLARYGEKVGLVFQLVDDLQDGDGAVRLEGAQAVRRRAQQLTRSAIRELAPLGKAGEPLAGLAEFILNRKV